MDFCQCLVPCTILMAYLPLACRPAWLQALVQAGDDDDDESSDGEWVAASEDDAAVDADDAGQQSHVEGSSPRPCAPAHLRGRLVQMSQHNHSQSTVPGIPCACRAARPLHTGSLGPECSAMLWRSRTTCQVDPPRCLPCAAAAALSWGDAGEEALTEVYNDGEEDAEEDGDGDADEGTCMQVMAAVSVGHSGLGYILLCSQSMLDSSAM